MKIAVMSATGEDNLIDSKENGDLEYRKKQLEKLKNEPITLEEINGGITIMDLGLNEFKLDLLEHRKLNNTFTTAPFGMHAVVPRTSDLPPGVIYVLKSLSNPKDITNLNHRLHPFYMVHLTEEGNVICNHLEPKKMLDHIRLLCKGKKQPIFELTRQFNLETKDGHSMKKYSELLNAAIQSIITLKDEKEVDSIFSDGETSFGLGEIRGLDDFELITFLVIK
jgi:hypothetical protein